MNISLACYIYDQKSCESQWLVCRFVDAIETVDDLVNSGIRWGAADEAWTYSMLNDETVSDSTSQNI